MKALIVVPRTGDGSRQEPYSNPLTCSWQDVTAQPVADIIAGQMAYSVEAFPDEAELAAIRDDGRYVVVWAAEDDAEPPEIDVVALKAALEAVYAADVADYVASADDPAEALLECQRRPPVARGRAVP